MGFPMVLLLVIAALLHTSPPPAAVAAPFRCRSPASCHSLIDYVTPNTTSISEIQSLFGVKNLRSILGANSLPRSSSPSLRIPRNETIRIPFPCSCNNGTGASSGLPTYTVQEYDTLSHVADEVFDRLITFQEIAAANNISNVNLIQVGQDLHIPLPCSCDKVNGSDIVHYGHIVKQGSSLADIARDYGTTEATVIGINGITNPLLLQAGAVIDVPLRACTSMVLDSSLDYPLLVSNGTYLFTANNCVMCSCEAANNWILHCERSQLRTSNNSGWTNCPVSNCAGLMLGDFTTGDSCNRRACVYTGYNRTSIHTLMANSSLSCPASDDVNHGTSYPSSWNFTVFSVHIILLLLSML